MALVSMMACFSSRMLERMFLSLGVRLVNLLGCSERSSLEVSTSELVLVLNIL